MSRFKFNPNKRIDGAGLTNGQRSENAFRTLLIYSQRRGSNQKDESNMRDLITDLLHLADETGGCDPKEELRVAVQNWRDER